MSEKRKSIVTKGISRLIQTKDFENVRIDVNIQEEIEWDAPAERIEKSQKVTKLLMLDFQETYAKALQELGLAAKPVTVGAKRN